MKKTTKPSVRPLLSISSCIGGLLIVFLLSARVYGQTLPSANLQQLALIQIPNWITSNAVGPTANVASFDVPSFNRVTGVMYLADRPNHGATAIDMKTLTYLGTIVPPGCDTDTTCSPSGILVAPDLQKLIVTTRAQGNIYIYDLRAPAQAPVLIRIPGSAPDELDYDPINQRAYIGSTASPFSVIVVDVAKSTLLGTIPFAFSVEQPRFNPVDGLIYVNSPDSHLVVVVDPQRGAFGDVINGFPVPNGCANAIDIDPVANTALLGCSAAPQQIVDLRTGGIVATFPLSQTDIGMFNSHNRRWYMGTRNTNATNVNCTKDTTNMFAAVGVFSNSPTPNTLVGVTCTGRGARVAGVDPILNNVFVPVVQFPADPNSADTGRPGILVFHDPAPSVTGTPAGTVQAVTQAVLTSVASSGVSGSVNFTLRRRNIVADAGLTGLPAGSTTTVLVITTSVGNEVVNCGVDGSGRGFCQGYLMGDPLIGGVVAVGSGGNRVASGTVSSVSTFPTFIPID